MYLLYSDESGSVTDASQRYFILAGFCVFERQAHWLSQELDKIAARFNPADPGSVELHGNPMRTGKNIFRRFPVHDRIVAIEDALKAFAFTSKSTRLFMIAVRKAAVSPRDPVEYCFEQLASRFDQYLMRRHRSNDTHRGIIIFDKSTYEATLQNLATDFRTVGHRWGVIRNLAEVPLFLDSKASRLIQLADLIAYAGFQKFEHGNENFYNLVSSKFDSDGGLIHGLHQRV